MSLSSPHIPVVLDHDYELSLDSVVVACCLRSMIPCTIFGSGIIPSIVIT